MEQLQPFGPDQQHDLSAAAPPDFSFIGEICRGDQQMIREMLHIFQATMEETIQAITVAYHQGNAGELLKIVHRVKPVLQMYQVTEAGRYAACIERLEPGMMPLAEMQQQISALISHMNAAALFVKKYLSDNQ